MKLSDIDDVLARRNWIANAKKAILAFEIAVFDPTVRWAGNDIYLSTHMDVTPIRACVVKELQCQIERWKADLTKMGVNTNE